MPTGTIALVCLILAASATGAPVTLSHLPDTAVNAVKVDGSGVYIAGFVGTIGSSDTYDGFVGKLSPDGSKVLYMTRFAGSKSDLVSALDIDSTGAAYVFGQTQSPDFPVTSGALQTQLLSSSRQGFVAKVDPQGKVVYATLIGGSATVDPIGGGILVDAAGEAYISGQTTGAGFPSTPGAPFTSTDLGTQFVARVDPAGARLLAVIRGLGGRLAFDGQGNLYASGFAVTVVSCGGR